MTETTARQFKTMTLRECGKFDWANKSREKLTGWGIICKKRQALGISRAQRVRANKLKAATK